MVFTHSRLGEVVLTHEEAMRLSAVWACVSVIANAIASSEWCVSREQANRDREPLYNSTAYYLLNKRPNPDMGPFNFLEATFAKALLFGDSYAEIELDVANRPTWLWPLEPQRCQGLERGADNELKLRVKNFDKEDTLLPYANVFHIHGLGLDGRCGLDLVGTAARGLLQALAAERFGLRFFQHGGSMGGVLVTDKTMTKEQLAEQRERVNERVAGVDNAFEFLLLAGGWKYQALTQDFDKSQIKETRYFLIEETCRWFGVPPHKIAHLLHATFSNIEHEGISFQRDGLRPWAVRGQQEADYKLLPNGPFSTQINLEWAAEGDAKSKAETDAILVRNGLAKRNERRRIRGQNSLGPAGDILTVESALTTLDLVAVGPQPGTGGNTAGTPARQVQQPQNQLDAARALFTNCFARCCRRQNLRAKEAMFKARTLGEFEARLDATEFAHRRYVMRELESASETLSGYNVNVAVSSEFTTRVCDDDRVTLRRAYEAGTVASAFDIDARAKLLTEGAIA